MAGRAQTPLAQVAVRLLSLLLAGNWVCVPVGVKLPARAVYQTSETVKEKVDVRIRGLGDYY